MKLALTATSGPTAVSYAYDGGPGLRRIERRIYRVAERVTVIDDRNEKPTTYRVFSVGVNVEDPADIDVHLIRQTKRGTDYVNGLGMWDGSRDIERFAERGGYWSRLAEILAAARAELAATCGRCGSPRSSARHWSAEGHTFEQAAPAPALRYSVYDGGGAAICDGCAGRLDFSHRAVDNATGKRVNVCSTCATSVRLAALDDEPVTVRPARRSSGYAIPTEPQDDPALTAGLLPLAGGDGFLF